MNFAPIILFTYNRPWHTQEVLNALALNNEAKESILYIFSDGANENASVENLAKIDEVRKIISSENRFKEVILKFEKENKGLANSVIDGVTEVINRYGNVIVLEDDIVTGKYFLKFMNDALTFYEKNDKVMHISGYMYPHKEHLPESFFFNVSLCWGWATWSRSWQYFENDSVKLWDELIKKNLFQELNKFGGDYLSSQLAHNIMGRLKTWFIKWHASVLLQNGYTLYPHISLVDNIGFDNSGVHNDDTQIFKNNFILEHIKIEPIEIIENKKAEKIIKVFYDEIRGVPVLKKTTLLNFKKRIKSKIRLFFYNVFPELKKLIVNDKINYIHNSFLGKECKVYLDVKLSNSIIGDYTYIAENSTINNTIIGRFCSIGPNLISGWGIHPTNGLSTHPMFYSTKKQNSVSLTEIDKIDELMPIHIGNDVFIGMNVTILDGVTIGDGAIIGAGAVVSKDILPYAIAVGNPIRIIKYRFDDEKINKLLKIKWWEFESSDLSLVEKYFFEVEEFINHIETKNNN